jgi:phosphoribosylanthranilate isomerase
MSPGVIKICGITNGDDALAAVDGGATAIGFNFYPGSKRYVTPEIAAEIAGGLAGNPTTKVGVFVNAAPSEMVRIAGLVGLDVVQLHGDETPEAIAAMPSGVRVWKAFRVEDGFALSSTEAYREAEAFLLDGPAGGEYGGAGVPFAWEVARGIGHKVILAGGLDSGNVGRAIAEARPWGVDACSRLESTPGKKDRRKLREFLRAAVRAWE